MMSPAARSRALSWLCVCAACVALCAGAPAPGPNKANHDLLTSLGLVRRRVAGPASASSPSSSPSHESAQFRRGAEQRSAPSSPAPDDSHMVVIKLPPAPYYYAHAHARDKPRHKPHKGSASASAAAAAGDPPRHHNDVSKVPLSFRSNGKPSGVYHWNLPVIKKMKKAAGHARHSGGGGGGGMGGADSKIYHIQSTQGVRTHAHAHAHAHKHAPSDNDVLKASESATATTLHIRKTQQLPKSKVSYYTPRRKTMFQKMFQGNGKPHSFYVIEKSKKPIHYHRLLP